MGRRKYTDGNVRISHNRYDDYIIRVPHETVVRTVVHFTALVPL